MFQQDFELKLETQADPKSFEATLVLFPSDSKIEKAIANFPENWKKSILEKAKKTEWKPKKHSVLNVEVEPGQWFAVATVNAAGTNTFHRLGHSKRFLGSGKISGRKNAWINLNALSENLQSDWIDTLTNAWICSMGKLPKYGKSKKEEKKESRRLTFSASSKAKNAMDQAQAIGEHTNWVRYMNVRAGNDLTSTAYIQYLKDWAKEKGLSYEFISFDQLKQKGAGAFVAVAQAAKDRNPGIVKLTYTPQNPKTKIALVGKGITYDTGGVNLKPGQYMFGMNGDMGGSALAAALISLAKTLQWDIAIEAYLAITENLISSQSYRPNDVITTLSGKTIEVIDTDAEGRMVLSDALWLASQTKPQLIMDFATLTGSCVRAIGTRFSGCFSNRRSWLFKLAKLSRVSGERLWPFPNDKDYGKCLKSKIADIKQCQLKGGTDHIEAAYFLSQFVPKEIPWVHIDLSSQENEGGLAHTSTEMTGFGVRLGSYLIPSLVTQL